MEERWKKKREKEWRRERNGGNNGRKERERGRWAVQRISSEEGEKRVTDLYYTTCTSVFLDRYFLMAQDFFDSLRIEGIEADLKTVFTLFIHSKNKLLSPAIG